MKKLWKLYLSSASDINGILLSMNIVFGLTLAIFIAFIFLKNNGVI